MRTAIAILTNTPPWVFALLALLIWLGCTALRPSSQPLPRMLIIPAVIFLMGLSRLVLGYAENGRGKTTLAAVLRSLGSGDPVPIIERHRLAAANPPHIVLLPELPFEGRRHR